MSETKQVQDQTQEIELVFVRYPHMYKEDVAITITRDVITVPRGSKVKDVELKRGENEVPIKIGDRTYKAKLIVEDEGRKLSTRQRLILPSDVAKMVVAVVRFEVDKKPEVIYGSGSIMYGREWDSRRRMWRTRLYYVNLNKGIKVDLGWWER